MSSSKINVNRSVQDPFYRYKMPRIIAKVEGKGNGIKTVIANMSDIAKALSRPPTYPTKYFGCELGAQTNFDQKNDRYIVNGEHDAYKLQDILDGFIKKFVLCIACENPETTLSVKKQSIHAKCKACGHSFIIDPKQKLSTYIVKNPPTHCEMETRDTETHDKHNSGSGGEENEENNSATMNGKLQERAMNCGSVVPNDEDWASEANGEQHGLSSQLGKLVIDKDLEKTVTERLDMLLEYFQRAKKDGSICDSKKMLYESERLELKTKAPLLLVPVLFDVDVLNQITKFRTLFLRFCINDKRAQKYLLGGVEQLIQTHKDVLLPKTAHIIKALYDEDICSEESLLSWGKKPSEKFVTMDLSKKLIKVAEPVLTWLKEAEEESESDDEEGEVAFDDRSRSAGTVVVESKNQNGQNSISRAGKTRDDDEEIDIDNI